MSFESNWAKSIAALFEVSDRLADKCSVRQYQPRIQNFHLKTMVIKHRRRIDIMPMANYNF